MLATIIITLLALPAALFLWSAQTLYVNKRKAQATGLPLLVRWVSPISPLWMIFGSSIVHRCRALGIGTKNFHRFYMFGWEGNERHLVHEELGSVFMLVTPGGIWMIVNDASVMAEVIRRRTDFRRNMEQFAVIDVYGKNLATTDDEEWQKHRKVTAITFTEKNNELVWQQSLLQAQGMLEYWLEKQPINTLAEDTKIFTLNVLAAAMYNKVYPFEADSKPGSIAKDDPNAYRDSLGKILKYIIPIFIWGEKGLQAWWVPKSWKAAGTAVSTFRDYITGLIKEERDMMMQGAQNNQHLVAALVRACENDALENGRSAAGMRNMTLTEQEIISNLFVYAFAGNDTTAVALTSLFVHLAAFPETQDWIAEELRHYLVDDDASQWAYDTFPKLKRCLAVVMESLRLNHPLSQLVKETGKFPQTIKIGARNVTLPPGIGVHLSLSAMHTSTAYWGDESMKWNPERFISSANAAGGFESEVLASDTQEHFLPWATGQRVCPGKKFSQVEMVAVLAIFFRDYTLQPVSRDGESMEQARRRIFETSLTIDHEGRMLFEISHPETIEVTWKKREDIRQ